tara:strand:+ start:2342 stop:2584 length:243 start_codon:yes stop_codon:yes gene_type:complete
MKFYKAMFDSRNFQFEAYGENETLAKEHLKKGLNNHAKQYQIPNDWWHEYSGDIYTVEIEIGRPDFNSCYRDNELIKGKQ